MGWLEIFEEKNKQEIDYNFEKKHSAILVVDDDPEITSIISDYLTSLDYFVYTAENAIEALEIYNSQSPQIIITDVLMPGMSGIDLLSTIRKSDSETEIILLTGHGDMSSAISALKNKASDLLLKPLDLKKLLLSLQKSESQIKLKNDLKSYTHELEELFKDVHHSRDYLETVLKNSPNATVTYNTKGIITSWNEAAEKITGYSKVETIGKTLKGIFVFDNPLIDTAANIQNVKLQNVIGQILNKNQEFRYINRNANILYDNHNQVIGGIESFYDITDKTNSDQLLEKRFMQVQIINEIGKKVASSVNLDELIELISQRLVDTFFESANIFFLLAQGKNNKLNIRAASGISVKDVLNLFPLGSEVDLKTTIIGHAFREGKSILCREVSTIKNLSCTLGKNVYSAYTFPITTHNNNYGVIHIENSERLNLDDGDIFLMETIAEYLAISIDKIELMEKITTQNGLLEKQAKDLKKAVKKVEFQKKIIEDHNYNLLNELKKAGEFQKSLLPEFLPKIEKYAFSVSFNPSNQLGGDYYDVFMIAERYLGLIVADASGHGVSSAMLSAMFKMTMSKYASLDLNPGTVFEKLNQDFCHVLQTGDFFSAFYGIIDLHTNKLLYCNAGHPLPLIYNYSSGKIMELDSEGFLLGVMPAGISYETKEFQLDGNYRMLIYTDALYEEVNDKNVPFGNNRVKNNLVKYSKESPDTFLNLMVKDLMEFTGHSIFSDDLTLLVMDVSC